MSSICLTTSWESLQISSRSTSSEWARLRPAMLASYSASLLEVWNPNLSAYSMSMPSREVRIRLAPLPCEFAAPTTKSFQMEGSVTV